MNTTHVITLDQMPPRSVVATFSDVHIPHHDERVLRLAVECAEYNGVTHTVANGDILDWGVGSRHPSKKARDTIDYGTLEKSVRRGKWFIDWLRSKDCHYLLGNHEKWGEDAIREDPELSALHPMDLVALPRDGVGWRVLPSNSRLRLGSFVWEHGHGIWPRGAGGANPGARVKAVAPQQVTFVGHLHRNFRNWWTVLDQQGVEQVYGVVGAGHLSLTHTHEDYAGGYPGWQQSFLLHYVYEVNGRPRMTVDQVVILRDHRDRPYFHYNGRLYK